MPSPIFLVNRYGNVRRKRKSSRFIDAGRPDLWLAGLINGYFTDIGMDFYFTNQGDADRFSLWTLWLPAALIETVGAEPWRVDGIFKAPTFTPNRYTGRSMRTESWIVEMRRSDGSELDLRFPHEGQARQFRDAGSYNMQSILGTLPANPVDVARQLEEFADRQRAVAKAKADAEEAARQAASGTPSTGTPSPPPAAPAPPSPPPPPTSPTPPPVVTGAQWWAITGGGAEGRYNGQFFPAGTFLYVGPEPGALSVPALRNFTAPGFSWSYAIFVTSGQPVTAFPERTTADISPFLPGAAASTITPDTVTGRAFLANQGLGAFEWYGIYQR